jgi:hypothetical protein
VESVDTTKLASELNKTCEQNGRAKLKVMVQVNTSDETSTYSFHLCLRFRRCRCVCRCSLLFLSVVVFISNISLCRQVWLRPEGVHSSLSVCCDQVSSSGLFVCLSVRRLSVFYLFSLPFYFVSFF